MYNWTLTGKGHCWILQRNWKAKTSSTCSNLRWGWIIEVELLHYFYSVLFWLWKIWKKQLKLNLCLYFYKFFKYVVFKCKLITNIWISMNTQILASEIDCIFVDAFFYSLMLCYWHSNRLMNWSNSFKCQMIEKVVFFGWLLESFSSMY